MRQNTKDINNLLTESLVIGFIYYKIMELVPISFGTTLDNLGILISAVIISYVLGRLRISKRILILFDKLKIYNTGNIYLWDDLMDANYSMKAVIEYNEKSYEGYIHYIESYSNSPHIALCLYTVTDKQGTVIEDNTMNATSVIVLDTNKADSIKIIYDNLSGTVKDIEQFLRDT